MPIPLIVPGILALLGGMAVNNAGNNNKQELEKRKNSRELLERDVIGPAIKSGDVDVLKLHEPTLKKYYPKDDLAVMHSVAETNKGKNSVEALQAMIAKLNGEQSQAGGQPQGAPQPSPDTGMFGAPPGTINEANVTGQPTRTDIPVAPSSTQVAQQTLAPPTIPTIPRLQAKPQITVTPNGLTANVTPITDQEQGVHQAQYQGAISWLDANPHVLKSYGTQLRDRLRAGDPKALEQTLALQKDPAVVPNVTDLMNADSAATPQEYRARLNSLFGDPAKAIEYETKHPYKSGFNLKDVQAEVRGEAANIAAKMGMPSEFVTPQIVDMAARNVLAEKAAIRNATTEQMIRRTDVALTNRSSTQAILKSSYDMTKKLAEDASFLSKADLAVKYLAQAGNMIYGKNKGIDIRPIDATMREFQGFLQAGKVGEAAALLKGWSTDVAILEQRFLGSSARMASEQIKKQEQNVPAITDKKVVYDTKLLRLHELFGKSEKQMRAKQKAGADLLRSNPHTQPAADAIDKGTYDISLGFLESSRDSLAQDPLPQVSVGTGDFK